MRDEIDCYCKEDVLIPSSFSIVPRNSHIRLCVRRHLPLKSDVIEGGTKPSFQVVSD